MFGRSSTVGDDHLVLWQFIELCQDCPGRNQERAWDVLLLVSRLRASVDDGDFVLFPKLVQFFRRDSTRIIRGRRGLR